MEHYTDTIELTSPMKGENRGAQSPNGSDFHIAVTFRPATGTIAAAEGLAPSNLEPY